MGESPNNSRSYFHEGSGRPSDNSFSERGTTETSESLHSVPEVCLSEESDTAISQISSNRTDPRELICCTHGRRCLVGKIERKERQRTAEIKQKYKEDKAKRKKNRRSKKKEKRSRKNKEKESKKSSKSKNRSSKKSKPKKKPKKVEDEEEQVSGYENLEQIQANKNDLVVGTVDDGQYENLDPKMVPHLVKPKTRSNRSKHQLAIRRLQSVNSPDVDSFNVSEFYVGVRSKKQAEKKCKQRTSFRVYHQMEPFTKLNEMPPSLDLFIVYRTSTGKHCHFPIKDSDADGITTYFVDYGDPSAPLFTTVKSLIRYYTVYVQLHYNSDGNIDPDVFPWWINQGQS